MYSHRKVVINLYSCAAVTRQISYSGTNKGLFNLILLQCLIVPVHVVLCFQTHLRDLSTLFH